MRLRRRTLRLGELLVHWHLVGLVSHLRLDLDVRVLNCHLARLLAQHAVFRGWHVLNMDYAWRAARRHVLRLEHLLLEVLAVPQLILLDAEAHSRVVIVAHGHLVGHVGRLHHNSVVAIRVMGARPMRT